MLVNPKVTAAMFGARPFAFMLSLVLLATPGAALMAATDTAGSVTRVTGRATVTTAQGEIKAIRKGTRLSSSDMISTSSRSYARLKMEDGSFIMVRPDSRLKIEDFRFKKEKPEKNRSILSLLKGGFRAVTGLIKDKRKYRYRTAVATIGIRGTDFSVRVCHFDCYDIDPLPKNGLFLEVVQDEVIITTKAGDFSFTRGQFAYVASSDAPAVLLDDVPEVFEQSPIPSADPSCEQ